MAVLLLTLLGLIVLHPELDLLLHRPGIHSRRLVLLVPRIPGMGKVRTVAGVLVRAQPPVRTRTLAPVRDQSRSDHHRARGPGGRRGPRAHHHGLHNRYGRGGHHVRIHHQLGGHYRGSDRGGKARCHEIAVHRLDCSACLRGLGLLSLDLSRPLDLLRRHPFSAFRQLLHDTFLQRLGAEPLQQLQRLLGRHVRRRGGRYTRDSATLHIEPLLESSSRVLGQLLS
mmetsp:Transcript_91589/g.245358  ORF Transcript_91589/g.245358 Transcript_91589/m.245358 type:complete len:226 (-) Transcript_91589:1206-1883(-)